MKGDLELSVAAMVSAGSRQRKNAAVSRNLPRCTSMGNFDSNLPIAVMSSFGVKALTSTREETARWMLRLEGGSRAFDRTSSIDVPSLTLRTLIRSARSWSERRSISGTAWRAICDVSARYVYEDVSARSCIDLPGCRDELS